MAGPGARHENAFCFVGPLLGSLAFDVTVGRRLAEERGVTMEQHGQEVPGVRLEAGLKPCVQILRVSGETWLGSGRTASRFRVSYTNHATCVVLAAFSYSRRQRGGVG